MKREMHFHFFQMLCSVLMRLYRKIYLIQLAVDGSILRFEFCVEISWKLVKKMLMDIEGIEALSPKKALQAAYQLDWIEDEQAWLQMLNDRNLTSHTYREEYALEIYSHLPAHLKNMRLLQNHLNSFIES